MNILFDMGWCIGRLTGALLMGAQVEGRENIPEHGAFILAPNHTSYLDPPLVSGFVRRRVHFFAKKELFDIPLFGVLLRGVQAHPIRRGGFDRQALLLAVELLKDGKVIAVFPEGTRGTNERFLDPKAGIGRIAQDSGAPILPVFLGHSDKFTRCLKREKRLQIRYGEIISASWIKSQETNKQGWSAIANEVMRRIRNLRDTLPREAERPSLNARGVAEDVSGDDTPGAANFHMIRISN